jgi:hypothetical protein
MVVHHKRVVTTLTFSVMTKSRAEIVRLFVSKLDTRS